MTDFFIDTYKDDKAPGEVIGSLSPGGIVRNGIDIEGVLSIDNSALRISPLLIPGWGRVGVVYGPYSRQSGLALGIYLLNGHNASQAGRIPEGFIRRILRWLRGSGTTSPLLRAIRWILHGQKRLMWRRILYWMKHNSEESELDRLDQNLVLGWFTSEVPEVPLSEGSNFIVQAAGPENSELCIRTSHGKIPVLSGLQNIPVYYLVVLRDRGAAYYAASFMDANGLPEYPDWRPLVIDPLGDDGTLYAGLYQSVMGQIGFRVDTRVYSTHIAQLKPWISWHGTAHAADQLNGRSKLDHSPAEIGGVWCVYKGCWIRSHSGAVASEGENLAILAPATPTGLVHVLFDSDGTERDNGSIPEAGLVWRWLDERNYCLLVVSVEGSRLQVVENGISRHLAMSSNWRIQPSRLISLQLTDNGEQFQAYLNGQRLFDQSFDLDLFSDTTGVGVYARTDGQPLVAMRFEAHPRRISLPTLLPDTGPKGWIADEIVVTDNFLGRPSTLKGRNTSTGDLVWRKEFGKGVFMVNDIGGCQVYASRAAPNPGRTAYTIPWEHPENAELIINLLPPGDQRGTGDMGRGGVIFMQDKENYIVVANWLDDAYEGASISSFFHLNGYEELYDAVWTNIGSRVTWGVSFELRVSFDGLEYLAFVNNEPVLFRSLVDIYPGQSRLKINRVGIVANWEWGDDTGTVFQNFTGKTLGVKI